MGAKTHVWFTQVEAQITTWENILQRTKFDHIVTSLLPKFVTEIRDIIFRPPADSPYDTLKEQLVKRTAASKQIKLQLLFSSEEIGEKKPYQHQHRMQQLLGNQPGIADGCGTFHTKLHLQITK